MSTPEATVDRKASRWEDYVDIFFSPGELYARRAHDPVAPAFWTLLVLSLVLYYAFLGANETVIRVSMETARAQLPQGADAPALDSMVRFATLFGGVMGTVMVAIGVFAAALLLWLIGRAVELKATYRQGLVVAVYAGFIYLLMQLASSVLAMVLGDGITNPLSDLSFGLLRFIEPATPPGVVEALLRRSELFLVWQAVVWAIGVRVVMGATRAQAAIVAGATWILFALPGVISAALKLGQNPG